MNHIHGQCVRITRAMPSRTGRGITWHMLSRKASPHSIGAALLAALLLTLATLLISAPARAGLLSNLLASYGDSGSGKVAHLEFRLDDATFAPTSVLWSPDGRFIATSGTQTRSIHIWDVAQRKLVKDLDLPNMPAPLFHNMAWSPDGRYLATCNSFATSLRIYATADWSVAKDFGWEDALGCQKPAFSSDGSELTVWSQDLVTFATSDWHVIRHLRGVLVEGNKFKDFPNSWRRGLLLHDIAYVPGTHTLVFGGGQYEKDTGVCGHASSPYPPSTGRVWILKPEDTGLIHSFVVYCPPQGGDVTYLAVRPDGEQLATGTLTHTGGRDHLLTDDAHIVSFPSGKLLAAPLDGLGDAALTGLAYTPNGRFLLVGAGALYSKTHAVHIIDAQTGRLLDTVHAPPDIRDIAVAPDSTRFAVATGTGVTVWKFVQP